MIIFMVCAFAVILLLVVGLILALSKEMTKDQAETHGLS